jgi:hypothetical protein
VDLLHLIAQSPPCNERLLLLTTSSFPPLPTLSTPFLQFHFPPLSLLTPGLPRCPTSKQPSHKLISPASLGVQQHQSRCSQKIVFAAIQQQSNVLPSLQQVPSSRQRIQAHRRGYDHPISKVRSLGSLCLASYPEGLPDGSSNGVPSPARLVGGVVRATRMDNSLRRSSQAQIEVARFSSAVYTTAESLDPPTHLKKYAPNLLGPNSFT